MRDSCADSKQRPNPRPNMTKVACGGVSDRPEESSRSAVGTEREELAGSIGQWCRPVKLER